MMTGEQLGVGHGPRRGTAHVNSWIEALENDPREVRAATAGVLSAMVSAPFRLPLLVLALALVALAAAWWMARGG